MQLNKVLATLILGATTLALAAPAPQDDGSDTSSSGDTPDSTLPPVSRERLAKHTSLYRSFCPKIL